MKKCTKCILPETYPEITFDEEGICNYCKEYKSINYKGEKLFVELLDKHINKGRKYDCQVPISGGRDSTYVLYKMKEKYKMNVLAFNYDNGFVSQQARENIELLLSKMLNECQLKHKILF
mgnify:CR=1 FL=1